MSEQPGVPEFDDRFWLSVHQRVESVRTLTLAELNRAEEELLTVQPEAEIVPVFPAPFWSRVHQRASKVRAMALDELADAEERLINRAPADVPGAWRSRVAAAARSRGLPRLPSISIPLKARVNSLSFVTAVLAALVVLTQFLPIVSQADVESRGPLSFLFSSLNGNQPPAPDGERKAGKTSSSSGADNGSSARAEGKAGGKSGSQSGATTSSASGGSGSSHSPKASPSPSPGAAGQAAAAATTPASPGDGADGASTEDGVSGAGPVPAAPSNLLVTAVDDTSVRLRWKDNSSDETGFVLERKGQTAVNRQDTDANTKSYIWTGLLPNAEYCFRVRARNSAGASDWVPAQYKCVTTHASPTSVPVQLTPIACGNEGALSSGPHLQETLIEFRNQTPQTIKIYALGRGGVRASTPTLLAPQQSQTIQTFLGDPYVVTRSDDASSCLAIFKGESWSSVATITESAT